MIGVQMGNEYCLDGINIDLATSQRLGGAFPAIKENQMAPVIEQVS